MSKWKFIYNGDGWWLRIENIEQLTEYAKQDTNSTNAFSDYLRATMYGKEHTNLSMALMMIGERERCSAIDAGIKLKMEFYKTYLDRLDETGFVNLNSVGGCNNIDYDIKLVEYRDKIVFPNYTEKDINIKTFKMSDYRENYKYHYYAYLGNLQIKDGDKVKWDTYKEAYDFAKQFISQ